MVVGPDHLARVVWDLVGQLDISALDAKRSWLGRSGYEPRRKLAVWVYASMTGLHEATKVAEAMKTDHAYLFLSGGYRFSCKTLSDFRAENRKFFVQALNQTVSMAVADGLVDPKDLAIDSMRLRADASTASVRTKSRSKKRVDELGRVDLSELSEEQREAHEEKVRKHQTAVERCEAEGRTSHSVTDPQASLMKFPNGASLPGHRITASSSKSDVRIVVSAIVDGAPTDYGKLEEAVTSMEDALVQAGVVFDPDEATIQVAADAGYTSEEDLRFAAEHRSRIDILIPIPKAAEKSMSPGANTKQIGKEQFTIREDGTAICPAGTEMAGPVDHANGQRTWRGVGCQTCPMKSDCTTSKARTLSENTRTKALRAAMDARMQLPDAKRRYSRRVATIEPVFACIEDVMGFRRASSRRTDTVVAEVFMKLLAYNLFRIHAAREKGLLDCVQVRVAE